MSTPINTALFDMLVPYITAIDGRYIEIEIRPGTMILDFNGEMLRRYFTEDAQVTFTRGEYPRPDRVYFSGTLLSQEIADYIKVKKMRALIMFHGIDHR